MSKNNQTPNPRVDEIISKTLSENQNISDKKLLVILNQILKAEKLPLLVEEDDRVFKIVNKILDTSNLVNDDQFNAILKSKLQLENIKDLYTEREGWVWWCYCRKHGQIAVSKSYNSVARKRLSHLRKITFPYHERHIRTYRDQT